jgi:secreted PhoX family phosphatase
MSKHEDELTNLSANPHIGEVIEQRLASPARRTVLRGSGAAAALAFLGAGTALLQGGADATAAAAESASAAKKGEPAKKGPSAPPNRRPQALGFAAVPKSLADEVTIAEGYTATVLIRLGDPLAAGVPDYMNDGSDAAPSFAQRSGDHHDAIQYYGLGPKGKWHKNESNRGLLCTNHEAITPAFLHPNGVSAEGSGAARRRTVADEVLREFYVHGVSIVEVERDRKTREVSYKRNSKFNRRVHTLTEMRLSGPAAGTEYMVTRYSPDGRRTRGTVNNCAHGITPWGTYLTCEENWAGYFRRVAAENAAGKTYTAKQLASFARYGVNGNGRELWATFDPNDDLYARWNVALKGETAADDYRNAANTYGWNVEIDPFDPKSTPTKRTAMGRFAHEGAWIAKVEAGKPLVFYMGCDARSEYIYKYVSNRNWSPADADDGLRAGDKYLDDGKLYVAKFNADGTGEWLLLDIGVPQIRDYAGYAFADQADVAINSRIAADAVGGTKMDRPEWGSVDPLTGAVYMTLTNNSNTPSTRNINALDAANPRFYREVASSPSGTARAGGNPNGHIIRWIEPAPAATRFNWDIFLFGARADRDENVNVSGLTDDNDFSSPDGLWFSEVTNICWIETDDGAFSDATNDMLLAALPGAVGDGGPRTITSTDGLTTKEVQTFVGAPLGDRLRRFLVGVPGCEITGITETPDGETLFVNVQHPGENTAPADIGDPAKYQSHWPDGGLARPRSATIVIAKNGGGRIGV